MMHCGASGLSFTLQDTMAICLVFKLTLYCLEKESANLIHGTDI